MTDHFRLGQYVRIGYRAWVNQFGGPVADKKSIDQLEADYRASQQREPSSPRPPFAPPHYTSPTVRSKGHKSRREWRGEEK